MCKLSNTDVKLVLFEVVCTCDQENLDSSFTQSASYLTIDSTIKLLLKRIFNVLMYFRDDRFLNLYFPGSQVSTLDLMSIFFI